MQKKRNTKSRVNDTLVILICLLGLFLSLLSFVKQINKSLLKLNESPIATITFKYKSAQRKFIDRVLWDRLKQESPVYDGDTIRTAPLSEATISFSDGNQVVLYENTLIQVFSQEEGINLAFSQGDVSLTTTDVGSSMRLDTNVSSVQVNSGAAIFASEKEDFQVVVNEGTAQIGESVIEKGQGKVVDKNGTSVDLSGLIMNSPLPNQKILSHSKDQQIIKFEWTAQNIPEDTPVVLEIAQDKEFTNILSRYSNVNSTSCSVLLGGGTYYWKLYTSEGTQIQSRLPIYVSVQPELIAPAENFNISYRTKKPSVRFMWTSDEYISYWQLEIADNKEFTNCEIVQRCTQPSSIISSLEKGIWYWRVKPYYTINNIGFDNISESGVFEIVQNAQLKPTELFLPKNNDLVNTKLEGNNQVYFSWKNNAEAVSYELVIADNENLTNPLFSGFTYDNYYSFDVIKNKLINGKWYWTVNYTDNEGNVSPDTEVRTFYGVDGELQQRTIFPPDGYSLNTDRTIDIRYTWKTNIPFETHYQIAKDIDFKDIIFDEVVNQNTIKGKSLAQGEWYWRIIAKNDDLTLQTHPKQIKVVPYLNKAEVIEPLNQSRCVVRPMTPVNFKWQEVEGAHYYQIKLYDKNKQTLLYEQNNIELTNVDINLENLPEDEYVWTIQAFAFETALSDRMRGMLSENTFWMKKLKPIELIYPLDNKYYEGADALLKPDTVSWSSVDQPAESEFIVTDDKNNVVITVKNPQNNIVLDQLREGTYYWTIKGTTFDNLDISAMKKRIFQVGPIQPLDEVTNLVPVSGTSFGVDYFSTSKKIRFTWNKHSKADAYIFTIYDSRNKELYTSGLSKSTYFTLEDLSFLDRGTFYWTVEPVTIIQGVVFQRGKTVKTKFIIDLPKIKKTNVKKPGALYGTD